MKTSIATAIIAIAALTIALSCQSCVTTQTKTTYPDGRVVEEKKTEPAVGAVETAGNVAGAIVESRSGK